MNRQQLATLRTMGIGVWVRRATTAADEVVPGAQGELVAGSAAAPVAVTVVWPGELRLAKDHAGGALLLKVFSALKAPIETFAVIRVDEARDVPAAVEAHMAGVPSWILCFSDERIEAAPDRVQLPSVGRMLRDESAKRPAWAALKPLVGKLGAP